MSSSRPLPLDSGAQTRRLSLQLDEFGSQALEQESARLGVSEEELMRFALLYYLADVDSGRVARSIRPGFSSAGEPSRQG
jgi:hypothetical protein